MNTSNQTKKIQGIARYVNWHEENIYCEVPPGEKNSFFPGHLLIFQVEVTGEMGDDNILSANSVHNLKTKMIKTYLDPWSNLDATIRKNIIKKLVV